eukprot:1027963-Amphidinium_carterae.1
MTEPTPAQVLAELHSMHERLLRAEERASAAEQRATSLEQTAARPPQTYPSERPLVDTRALGRPREFKSERTDWKDWSFQFKAFLAGANAAASTLLDKAATREGVWRLEEQSGEEQRLSNQLYLALSLQVTGAALVKSQNVEQYNGLEAWRQLTLEYEPRTRGRQRMRLTQLLRPEKALNVNSTVDVLEAWEREVKEYERTFQKPVDEDIRIGVLTHLAPEKVAEHLYLYSDTVRTYADARKVVVDYVEAMRSRQPGSLYVVGVG